MEWYFIFPKNLIKDLLLNPTHLIRYESRLSTHLLLWYNALIDLCFHWLFQLWNKSLLTRLREAWQLINRSGILRKNKGNFMKRGLEYLSCIPKRFHENIKFSLTNIAYNMHSIHSNNQVITKEYKAIIYIRIFTLKVCIFA